MEFAFNDNNFKFSNFTKFPNIINDSTIKPFLFILVATELKEGSSHLVSLISKIV